MIIPKRVILSLFIVFVIISIPICAYAQHVEVSPRTFDFGEVLLGESAVQSFEITSLGPTSLNLIFVNLLAEEWVLYEGEDFNITKIPPGVPGEIRVDESVEYEVTYAPTTVGPHECFLFVFTNDTDPPGDELIYIHLSGEGVEEITNTAQFKLAGAEIIKGCDFGDIRYGTTFIGKVHEGSDALGFTCVGRWWTVIQHTNTENIEVCGGTNNLLRVNLVVVFESGSLAGNKLVLGLKEPDLTGDVVWDSMAPMCGPAFFDDDCVCPNNPEEIEEWDCDLPMPPDYGPVATVPGLELIEKFGSTLSIEEAYISGYLCHNWLYVPRVLTYLFVEWK